MITKETLRAETQDVAERIDRTDLPETAKYLEDLLNFEGLMDDSAYAIATALLARDKPKRLIVHEGMHWTLAEAIDACAVLYRQTGKAACAERYAESMQYLDACVLDHVHGSWFHQMDRQNHVSGSVWPGKPDIYHALQATLIPYHGADASIAVMLRQASAL